MELFIILLLFGYFKFFKGVVKQTKRKEKPKKRSEASKEHPYAPYRQVTFDELQERMEEPKAFTQEGVDPCHEEMLTTPRKVTPMEGVDPCHEPLFRRPERIVLEEEEASGGWKPDLSQAGLWQAVVMQEVLTRPCQRQRR